VNPTRTTRTPTDDPATPALGSDPFAELPGTDPFLDGLAALGLDGELAPGPAEAGSEDATEWASLRLPDAPRRERAQRPAADARSSPAGIEPAEGGDASQGWLDMLLDDDERRRLAALARSVDNEVGYDRYGFSPEVTRRAFPFFRALHRFYFRVRHTGFENVPTHGPAVIAANHGGLLPFDGAMLVMDILLHSDPPRLARAVVDRWAGRLPWVNVFYARVGQVVGTRENFADLLANGQLVLVFPEGTAGIRKTVTQRHRLQRFHVGFVEQALLAGAPIVPAAVIGSDDQSPILYDFQGLARRLGLPALPVTPTFPWLGPFGLLPYPVGYHIVYGEPLGFHERFGPEDAADANLVEHLARRVRGEIQHLVDRNR